MNATKTISEAQEIVQDNLDYTLFSWSKQRGISPIAVKYGEGVYLYDYDGKRYIEFSMDVAPHSVKNALFRSPGHISANFFPSSPRTLVTQLGVT